MSNQRDQVRRAPTYQSAAVPYRYREDRELQVLLVTSRNQRRWVLPKGKVKRGLLPHVSAAREAFEEAGVLGDIEGLPIGTYRQHKFGDDGESVQVLVEAYAMRVTVEQQAWPEMSVRQRSWMRVDEAVNAVGDPAIRALLLILAETMARRLEPEPGGL